MSTDERLVVYTVFGMIVLAIVFFWSIRDKKK
ncbi:hypothetical protein CLORY_28880 [Clostridium oryzae]|uniref:Uncharacterized protein n=1 Tax=Clostridium oryzae TaxID=1450648 RepID=A0A1V4IK81_9CLOT|nr:hypothetical protein CLORY_28880 [Clostridium oryzae]